MVPLSWYLALSAVLFTIGVAGVLVQRNVISIFMCIELMLNSVNLTLVATPNEPAFGTVEAIGEAMFSSYLFPFEATSVLILMAMVGSLILARKRTAQEIEHSASFLSLVKTIA